MRLLPAWSCPAVCTAPESCWSSPAYHRASDPRLLGSECELGELVFLDLHVGLCLFFDGGKVELVILDLPVFILQLGILFLEHLELVRLEHKLLP